MEAIEDGTEFSDFVFDNSQEMETNFQKAEERIKISQSRQRKSFEKRHKRKPEPLQEGDKVLIKF